MTAYTEKKRGIITIYGLEDMKIDLDYTHPQHQQTAVVKRTLPSKIHNWYTMSGLVFGKYKMSSFPTLPFQIVTIYEHLFQQAFCQNLFVEGFWVRTSGIWYEYLRKWS